MAISISEYLNPDSYRSKHWIHTKTGDNKEMINVSGTALVHWEGTSQDWEIETLNLCFKLPNIIPDGKLLRVEQWTPLITLNAIYNKNHAINAGWAVNQFWGPGRIETDGAINLWAEIAIRDDGYLYRVAYSLSLIGRFIDDNRKPFE